MKDRYGLELSTTSSEARDAYVDAIDRMLAADGHVEETLAHAIEADPSFALAHIAVARQHQLMARGKEARAVAEEASELVATATEREQRHVEILANLITGQVPRSLELTREHIVDHPRDAFALAPSCGVFGTIGFSGRIGREQEQLELLEPLATHYGDDWWYPAARWPLHCWNTIGQSTSLPLSLPSARWPAAARTSGHVAHTLGSCELYEADRRRRRSDSTGMAELGALSFNPTSMHVIATSGGTYALFHAAHDRDASTTPTVADLRRTLPAEGQSASP